MEDNEETINLGSKAMVDNTLSKNIERVFAIGEKDRKALEQYVKTINRIDDFFEYANESKSDRLFIHKQLDILTLNLKKIYNSSKSND